MNDLFCSRRWITADEVKAMTGLSAKGVRRRLTRLHAAGVMERQLRGDGTQLWRLAERFVRAQVKAAER